MAICHGRLRRFLAGHWRGWDDLRWVKLQWDHNLYALNPDGSLKWQYPTGGGIDSSPAIGADGAIYVGSGDDNLYSLNPDGSLKWRYPTGVYRLLAGHRRRRDDLRRVI